MTPAQSGENKVEVCRISSSSIHSEQLCAELHSLVPSLVTTMMMISDRASFEDVSLKWDQMVVGKVGDVRLCFLVTHVRFHRQKLCSILVSGDKTKDSLPQGRDEPEWSDLKL